MLIDFHAAAPFKILQFGSKTNCPLKSNLWQSSKPNDEIAFSHVDNRRAIHWRNYYPSDSVVCFVKTYPLASDLFGG